MHLNQLLNSLEYTTVTGSTDLAVDDIVYDSRKAGPNTLFVCLTGSRVDGHDFVRAAYEAGTRAFLCEHDLPDRGDPASELPGATIIRVENTRFGMAIMSANLFDHPAEKLKTIAVTGTKGKTSHCFMVRSILEAAGFKVGIIGSIGVVYGDNQRDLPNTTPESYEIHKLLAEMLAAGCTHVVMEASSTGFHYHRTAGLVFDVGVFTNLTPDHIAPDEHPDFDHYKAAKRQLFSQCRVGVINADSPYASYMAEGAHCPIVYFGVEREDPSPAAQDDKERTVPSLASYLASNICAGRQSNVFTTLFDCSTLSWQRRLTLNIPGEFSVYNALSALAACDVLAQVSPRAVEEGLRTVTVLGRMETVPTNTDYTVMIDYAHNAISTESLMDAVKEFATARIICVFGCGGNRAAGRREGMGRACGEHADLCIITSDNPRRENPLDIIAAVEEGVKAVGGVYEIVPNRREAIHHALSIAEPGDLVLIIGKGHEMYQEINGEFLPFDERKVVAEYFE